MTQVDLILKQLRQGRTVTRLTALHLGIAQINEVIARARAEVEGTNERIETVMNTDGFGRRYGQYVLHTDTPVAVAA